MGGQNQPISNQTTRQTHPQQIPSKHPRFTDANIVESQEQSLYFQVSQSIGNILTYNSWEKKITEIKKKIGPNSLYLPIECEYQQHGLCGTSGTLKFKFQHFAFLLDEEITNRQQHNLPFEEKELWFLLYILTQTAAALHKIGCVVGDILPKNIFINHSGDIAVYNMFSFCKDFTNFQKVRYFKEFNYLPPQGVNDIQTGKQIPSYDEKIGESFSIGLTILDAIFLTDHSFLYDKMERFNEIAFIKILQTLQKLQLSQKLKTIISSLLSINPQKRLSCEQLCEYLSPYEKQIFELEEFQIETELLRKNLQQIQESPAKSIGNSSSKSKKASLSRPISLNNTEQKVLDIQHSDRVSFKITQNSRNRQEVQAQQTRNSVEMFKSESNNTGLSNSSMKKLQKPLAPQQNDQSIVSTSTFEHIKLQQNNVTQNFLGFSKKDQLNSSAQSSQQRQSHQKIDPHLLNQQLYHISRPDNTRQFERPPSKNVSIQNQPTKMTFNTGKRFQRQKSSASIIMTENIHAIKETFPQIKKGQPYQAPYQIPKFQLNMSNKNQFKSLPNNIPASTGSNIQQNDFLRNIERQIQQSRKMFPDSLK